MADALQLEQAGSPLDTRAYVLLVSGTMNPPHIGHVRLGLQAAAKLQKLGHKVKAIQFVPVHDNYLCNKGKAAKNQNGVKRAASLCFPMEQRCKILRKMLGEELQAKPEVFSICEVSTFEHEHPEILSESPQYWAPKLPEGYLKTVPTAKLIQHFANFARQKGLLLDGERVGLVYGVDNFLGMATWNSPEQLLEHSDLILTCRGGEPLEFTQDPTKLFQAMKHFEVRASVPVKYKGELLFGDREGSFINSNAKGDGALLLLPALEGKDEGLSSTAIRESLCALADHGYFGHLVEELNIGMLHGSALEDLLTKGTNQGHFVSKRGGFTDS